MKINLIYSI